MKKLLAVLTILIITVSMVGCGKKSDEKQIKDVINSYANALSNQNEGKYLDALDPESEDYADAEENIDTVFETGMQMKIKSIEITEINSLAAEVDVELSVSGAEVLGTEMDDKEGTASMELRKTKDGWKISDRQ